MNLHKFQEVEPLPFRLDVWSPLFLMLKPLRLSMSICNELIRFVSPPPELTSSYKIFENLNGILKQLAAILKADQNKSELAGMVRIWERYCELIASYRDRIEAELPDMFIPSKNLYTPPFFGHYETHPLGVAMWCAQIDPSIQERYRLLQAYLCLATYMLRPLEARNPHLHANAKILGCRAVRKLAFPENINYLRKLPETAVSLGDYRKALAKALTDKAYHPIIAIFDLALMTKQGRGKGARKRSQSNKFNKQGQTIEFGDEGDDDNPDDREQIKVLTVSAGKKSEIQARKKALCANEEFNSKEFVGVFRSNPTGIPI